MRSQPIIGTLLLVGACGHPSYIATLTASPSAAPADVIGCVRDHLKPLGYSLSSFDETDNRLTAQKNDPTAHKADPTFWRNSDRLEAQATPEADGTTKLTISARTFVQRQTHAGPRDEEEAPSEGVKQAAQSLLDTCGQS